MYRMSIPTNFMPLVPKVFEDALAGWEAELEDKVGKKLVCITKVGLSLSTTMNRNLAQTPPPPTTTQTHNLDYGPRHHVEHGRLRGNNARARLHHISRRSVSMVGGRRPGHLAARSFANRQVRNITANKGTRYENKIVGDSPEMCRALD